MAVLDVKHEETASLLEELPGEGHLCVTGNAGVEEDVRSFAEKVLECFGCVDVLVNNACITRRGILSGCSFEEFNEVLRVGVSAPYLLSLLFRDHFSRGASIVNIASTRASMSRKDTESYSAAKGALTSLTHALSMSLSPFGVRVNSVSPGWIDTGLFGVLYPEDAFQHPSGRVGSPEDIVKAGTVGQRLLLMGLRFRHAFLCSCFKQVPCRPDAYYAWNWDNSGRAVRLPP